AGPKVREYYVLRHLAQQHTVTLAAFVRDGDSPDAHEWLRSVVTRLVVCPLRRSAWGEAGAAARSLLTGEPVLIARDRRPELVTLLRQAVSDTRFDVIHADQLWMAPYALAAASMSPVRPRLVLDQHNAVHLIPRRLADSARNPGMRLAWRREAR